MTVRLDDVLACLGEVLDRPDRLPPDVPLTELGLDSFTAVRLRRRLREETGLSLPLPDFLGGATARTVAETPAGEPVPTADPSTVAAPASPPDGTPFPLTAVQSAYLVGRDPAFPLGGVATFWYQEFDRVPDGDPLTDLDRLAAAWDVLVRRHPMLRMVVGDDGRQRVLPEVPATRIATTDLRADPDPDARLGALREECSHQVRPPGTWPLHDLRAALLPDGRTRLHIGIDVLALDLTSWMVLMREWGEVVADPGVALPPLPTTFAALTARTSTDPAERERRDRDRAYWADRAPLPAGPTLPWTGLPWTDPPGDPAPRMTRHTAVLDADTWGRLRAAAARHGLSPTGALLAAFAFVLHRFGAEEPFALNATLFDRDDVAAGDDTPGLDRVVGDFTSTVLVAVEPPDLRGRDDFAAFAGRVNRRFWADLEHRSVPGVEVTAGTAGPRDPRTGLPAPAHPVVFTSGLGLTGDGPAATDWLGEEVFGISQTPQVLLDHIVHDAGGVLRVHWDLRADTLPAGFVPGLRDAHHTLLRRLADEPGAWTDPTLGHDPSTAPAEPVGPNPFTECGPLLDDPWRAAVRPGRPALLDARGCVAADVLAARADRTGAALAGLGAGPGDLVAVCVDKGIAQVTALLGVLASGAGYVPVEPSWPAARIASVCARSGLRHALVAPGDDTTWPDGVRTHVLDADGVLVGDAATPRRADPGDLAYAIFTSGSTGTPKGVGIAHRAARTTLDDLESRYPLRADDRVLALSAFSFDLSVYDVFSVLGAGGGVVLPDADRQRDPGHWLELMAAHRVTVWNTAPALLEMLVEYAEIEPEATRRALASLRQVFLSADWIPVTLPDRLRALAPQARVIGLGGATEASIWSISYPVDEVDPAWPSIPYGRALGGQSFHVLDPDDGRPCPVGRPGELFIGGDGLAEGYVGDPDQTAARFAVHPTTGTRLYRTGDLGRWRPDGTIEFLGRTDRQVKIRGHRIELGELEATLDRLPAVRHAVAQAVRGPDDRPRLVAFVVPADPASPPGDGELAAALRAALPPYMVPNRFVVLAELPITANGKVDHSALPNPFTNRSRTSGPVATAAPAASAAAPVGPSATAPTAPVPAPASATLSPAATSGAASSAAASLAAASSVAASSTGVESAGAGTDVTAAVGGHEPAAAGWPAVPPQGIELRLTVGCDGIGPVDALVVAAPWVQRLRAELRTRGATVAERTSAEGLVELVVTTSATSSAPSPAVPAEASPAPAPAPAAQAAVLAPPAAGPPDPLVERTVARVFSDLLGGPVEVTTPFFQLGASSLTLVLAHRRLVELDPQLTVVDLFAYPTVRDLARHLTATAPSPTAPTAPAAPTTTAAGPTGGATPPVADPPAPPPGDGRAAARRAARARAVAVAG